MTLGAPKPLDDPDWTSISTSNSRRITPQLQAPLAKRVSSGSTHGRSISAGNTQVVAGSVISRTDLLRSPPPVPLGSRQGTPVVIPTVGPSPIHEEPKLRIPDALERSLSMEGLNDTWQQAERLAENDPHPALVRVPRDDVQVEILKRERLLLADCVPSANEMGHLPRYMSDWFQWFRSDWYVVVRKYIAFSQYPDIRAVLMASDQRFTMPVYEVDHLAKEISTTLSTAKPIAVHRQSSGMALGQAISLNADARSAETASSGRPPSIATSGSVGLPFDSARAESLPVRLSTNEKLTEDEAEQIDHAWLDYAPHRSESEAAQQRLQDRHDIFQVFNDADALNVSSPQAPFIDLPVPEKVGRRLYVDRFELSLALAIQEPFFLSATLFDLSAGVRRRISETLDISLGDPASLDRFLSMHRNVKTVSPCSRAQSGVFSISYPNTDIYLVIRIEKCLEGDMLAATEKYSSAPKSGKSTPSRGESIESICARLGRYRQPFAWCVLPLFNESGQLDLSAAAPVLNDEGVETGSIQLRPLLRAEPDRLSDEDLIVHMLNQKRGTMPKRHKTMPGHLELRMVEVTEQSDPSFWPSLSTHLLPLTVPASLKPSKDAHNIVKDIQEFIAGPPTVPFQQFVHHLFIYPGEVNFTKAPGKARNITCKIQVFARANTAVSGEPGSNNALSATRPLPIIYARSSDGSEMTDTFYTTVSYHERHPCFYDEVKIALPLSMTADHHVLFSFYHLSCKMPTEKASSARDLETPVGYAVLPLITNGRVIGDGMHDVCVASQLVADYMRGDASIHNKYLDNQKKLFMFQTRLVSSIVTQNEILEHFFHLIYETEPGREADVAQCIRDLTQVPAGELLQFCPLILDQLFTVLCSTKYVESLVSVAFQGIVHLILALQNDLQGLKRHAAVASYAKYYFKSRPEWDKPVFEQLISVWLHLIQTNDPKVRDTMKVAWFLLEIISKSVLEYRVKNVKLNLTHLDRAELWLKPSFLTCLDKLVPELTLEVVRRSKIGVAVGKDLNESLAQFLCDTFRFLDRSRVFRLINSYMTHPSMNDSETMQEFKFEFLRILCGHEHYIAYNLPLASYEKAPIDKLSHLTRDFWKRYYLAGLLLHEVALSLVHRSSEVRIKALTTLKDVLAKHDLDGRFVQTEWRSHIAAMYFPFILTTCDALPSLQKGEMGLVESRLMLICFFYILKTVNSALVVKWLRKEGALRLFAFVELLIVGLDFFEYAGKSEIEDRILNGTTTSIAVKTSTTTTKRYIENTNRAMGNGPMTLREIRGNLRAQLGSASRTIDARDGAKLSAVIKDMQRDIKLEGILAREIGMISLDIFEALYEDYQKSSKELEKLSSLYVALLARHQSDRTLKQIFVSLKCFLHRSSQHFFRGRHLFSGELARLLLHHCTSSLVDTRIQASGLIYLMMKRNQFETKTNFSKTRIQLLVALSKLNVRDDHYLRRSLATVKLYAKSEPRSRDQNFIKKVNDLVENLFSIMRDSIRMALCVHDPEMLVDMHHRIARGFTNAPDLRLSTLETLSNLHFEQGNFAESGIVLLHCAALVAEYLYRRDVHYGGPKGSIDFVQCSQWIDEKHIFLDETNPDDEGICQGPLFTELGLMQLLERATQLLNRATLFETVNQTYKLLLPLYEKHQFYEKLAKAHEILQQVFLNIGKQVAQGRRIIGAYYRVVFHGSKFESLDGKEFIYRERTFTQLVEVCQRFEKQYGARFGSDFKLVQEAGILDRSKLDPSKAYLQITFVEPYLDPEDLQTRKTQFDRVNDIYKFSYETPFTKTGKARGEVHEQYIRKSILHTAQPFPAMQTRLEVVHRREVELTPLQVSIAALMDRVDKLRSVMEAKPPSLKQLQMVLQGSVRLQVNAGPLEIARVFLDRQMASNYPAAELDELRAQFRYFLDSCARALQLNKLLIKADQVAYQEDLEDGFEDVRQKLSEYLDPSDTASSTLYDFDGENENLRFRHAADAEQVASVLEFIQGQSGLVTLKLSGTDDDPAHRPSISEIASFFTS